MTDNKKLEDNFLNQDLKNPADLGKKGQTSKAASLLLVLLPIVFILAAFIALSTFTKVVDSGTEFVDDMSELLGNANEIVSNLWDGKNVIGDVDPAKLLMPKFSEKVDSGRYTEWEELLLDPLFGKFVDYSSPIVDSKTRLTLIDALVLHKRLNLEIKASTAIGVAATTNLVVNKLENKLAQRANKKILDKKVSKDPLVKMAQKNKVGAQQTLDSSKKIAETARKSVNDQVKLTREAANRYRIAEENFRKANAELKNLNRESKEYTEKQKDLRDAESSRNEIAKDYKSKLNELNNKIRLAQNAERSADIAQRRLEDSIAAEKLARAEAIKNVRNTKSGEAQIPNTPIAKKITGKLSKYSNVAIMAASAAAIGASKLDLSYLEEQIGIQINGGKDKSCLYLEYSYLDPTGNIQFYDKLFYYNTEQLDDEEASNYITNNNYAVNDEDNTLNIAYVPRGEKSNEYILYYWGECVKKGGEK